MHHTFGSRETAVMTAPRVPALLVRTIASVATIACVSILSTTPARAQPLVEAGVGSTVRVVHARCFLCRRKTVEGSISAMTSDSMHLARSHGSSGVAFRDVRWIGTPSPISRANGAIAGAKQGLVLGVLLGATGAVVARTIRSHSQKNRTDVVLGTVGASTLGGAVIGAARRTTRWRRIAKPSWPHGADSVSLRD